MQAAQPRSVWGCGRIWLSCGEARPLVAQPTTGFAGVRVSQASVRITACPPDLCPPALAPTFLQGLFHLLRADRIQCRASNVFQLIERGGLKCPPTPPTPPPPPSGPHYPPCARKPALSSVQRCAFQPCLKRRRPPSGALGCLNLESRS